MESAVDTIVVASPHEELETSSPEPLTPTAPVSPITPHEAHHLSNASLSSISLSENDFDFGDLSLENVEEASQTPKVSATRHMRKPSSLEILQNVWQPARQSTLFDAAHDVAPTTPAPESDDGTQMWAHASNHLSENRTPLIQDEHYSTPTSFTKSMSSDDGSHYSSTPMRRSTSSEGSDNEVDWQKLEMTELQEKTDKEIPEGAVDDSTAFLLARLEQGERYAQQRSKGSEQDSE